MQLRLKKLAASSFLHETFAVTSDTVLGRGDKGQQHFSFGFHFRLEALNSRLNCERVLKKRRSRKCLTHIFEIRRIHENALRISSLDADFFRDRQASRLRLTLKIFRMGNVKWAAESYDRLPLLLLALSKEFSTSLIVTRIEKFASDLWLFRLWNFHAFPIRISRVVLKSRRFSLWLLAPKK